VRADAATALKCARIALVILLVTLSVSAWAQTVTAQYVYAIGPKPGSTTGLIAGYRVNADGTLTLTQSPFPVSDGSFRAALASAQGAKLFVLSQHKLWSFGVNPTNGTIKLLSSVTFPDNIQGLNMVQNASSTLLFVVKDENAGTSLADRRITTYRVSSAGALTANSSSVVVPGFGFDTGQPEMAMDPSGRFLYTPIAGGVSEIAEYTVNNTTGAVTFFSTTVSSASPGVRGALAVSSRFVYYSLPTSGVTTFSMNTTTGQIAPIQTVACGCTNTLPADFAGSVALNARGTVLIQREFHNDSLSMYTVNQTTGLLTPRDSSIDLGQAQAPIVSWTPARAGDLLFLGDELRNIIQSYHVSDAGTITAVPGNAPIPPSMGGQFFITSLAVKR